MSWTLLIGLVLLLAFFLFAAVTRRQELAGMQKTVRERDASIDRGSHEAKLQHPVVDLSRCLGCGTCVAVCPEDNVLEIVHGQAVVVDGASCIGVAACERECPVSAITVTIRNLDERDDVPATDDLEAIGSPGLFLAGEVTAFSLIRTAVEHGTQVGREVARRTEASAPPDEPDVLDLCIVGAGPGGLSCALEAKRAGLEFVVIEQEAELGGTISKYPRHKLVLAEPVDIPLYGSLAKRSYRKEELIRIWRRLARENELPIYTSQIFRGLERDAEAGVYYVETTSGTIRARNVCLAIGRRGVPRKLDVPGEELPHVAYALMDAQTYAGRRVLVVGGGDTAVEAALGLAEQSGTQVSIACRRDGIYGIRSKNAQRLEEAVESGRLEMIRQSRVVAIHEDRVDLEVASAAPGKVAVDSSTATAVTVPVDDVFVLAGGVPPFDLLSNSGVSFDSSLREKSGEVYEQGSGLVPALTIALGLALATLLFAIWHVDYYGLSASERPAHVKHGDLRPGLGVGLWFGIAATVLIVVNLLYVLRRSPRVRFRWGSLQTWMTSHVATGVLAFLLTLLHAGMAPRDTSGGHAFWALAILLVTGGIGRYFYAWVPRAANGRELELGELKAELRAMSSARGGFYEWATSRIEGLIRAQQWGGSFFGRVLALLGVRRDLRRTVQDIRNEGRARGISKTDLFETLAITRRAHAIALSTAHFEDLRGILNTWRWVHRWIAALMVLLLIIHIVHALTFGSVLGVHG